MDLELLFLPAVANKYRYFIRCCVFVPFDSLWKQIYFDAFFPADCIPFFNSFELNRCRFFFALFLYLKIVYVVWKSVCFHLVEASLGYNTFCSMKKMRKKNLYTREFISVFTLSVSGLNSSFFWCSMFIFVFSSVFYFFFFYQIFLQWLHKYARSLYDCWNFIFNAIVSN